MVLRPSAVISPADGKGKIREIVLRKAIGEQALGNRDALGEMRGVWASGVKTKNADNVLERLKDSHKLCVSDFGGDHRRSFIRFALGYKVTSVGFVDRKHVAAPN